jgi:hypothetical protein
LRQNRPSQANEKLSVDEVTQRYPKVGGVPRHIFADDSACSRGIESQNFEKELTDGEALALLCGWIVSESKSSLIAYDSGKYDNRLLAKYELIVISGLVAEKIATKYIRILW